VTHMNRLKSKARSPKSKVAIYGRARHSVRAVFGIWTSGGQRTARPTNSIHQHQHAHLLRKASLTGEFVCFAEILFLSVFICVHSWLKDFSNA
jgi:hypothetical protein